MTELPVGKDTFTARYKVIGEEPGIHFDEEGNNPRIVLGGPPRPIIVPVLNSDAEQERWQQGFDYGAFYDQLADGYYEWPE